MGRLRDFIDFIKDSLWITKICFSSGWFWLPVVFGVYICAMPLIALAVHPATLLIVPAILIAYLIISEDKRLAAQYSLKKKDGSMPGAVKWDVKKSVEEYFQILNRKQEIQDKQEIEE